jgi:hypothetical protein
MAYESKRKPRRSSVLPAVKKFKFEHRLVLWILDLSFILAIVLMPPPEEGANADP